MVVRLRYWLVHFEISLYYTSISFTSGSCFQYMVALVQQMLTLQKSGNMLYSLSSRSFSVRWCDGWVYSENSFLRCISPKAVCCGFELASSCEREGAEAPPARNLRTMFIMKSESEFSLHERINANKYFLSFQRVNSLSYKQFHKKPTWMRVTTIGC